MRPTKLFHTIVVIGASLGAAACGGDDDGTSTDGGTVTDGGSTTMDGGSTDGGMLADASMLDAMMSSDAGPDDGGEEDGMVLIL